jgi:hypothetical protein
VQTLVGQGVDQRITVTELTGDFTEVGAASGTDNNGYGTDVAWGDYDNDGDLDLYVADDFGTNRLYRNNGNGAFDEVGAASGVDGGQGRAAVWGDYDNDGDLDLYLATRDDTNRLYRNEGNGTFSEVGAASGTDNPGPAQGVGWADYDNDGDLDLYVVDEGGGANRLYRNEGNGTFTEVGAASGTNNVGDGRGVAWADYDNDGDVDFYVSRNGTNLLYHNNGDGTFTDVGVASGTNSSGENTGAVWGDYDNDGDLDLYVAKFGSANLLYRNNGNGTFVEVGVNSDTNDTGNSNSVAWGDFDNDGDLDLYVANDGANRLYRNEGNGTFREIGAATGTDDGGSGAGVAWGDYDDDGDLDLYLANFGSANRLYRNENTGNHWLHVDLVGTVSNRSGIGARLRCVSVGASQIREICGSSGRFSQASLTAEFGLGTTAVVDTLEIRWPSGIVQKIVGPGVDQRITVTETGPTAVPKEPVPPKQYALYANMPNPFNPATTIRFDLPSDGAVDLRVYDVSGRLVRALLNGSHYPVGRHQVAWDGRNEHGHTVASGVYFYRIRTNEFIATRRMLLLK